MDIAEFLQARIAEDEEFALRYPPAAAARPRALAECESKRLIAAMHEPYDGTRMCAGCDGANDVDECPTLFALALPYADHPDYDPEWKV